MPTSPIEVDQNSAQTSMAPYSGELFVIGGTNDKGNQLYRRAFSYSA
jgi:hypothetical protein